MRHRATTAVRVLDRCARCGGRPTYYAVRRVDVTLAGRRHQLVVCQSCDRDTPNNATSLERQALGVDLGNPVECMEFIQSRAMDPERIVRTAEYFLGESFASEREDAQRAAAAVRDRDAVWYERYAASRAERWSPEFEDEAGMGDPPDDD
jgi:hypothetical protein